ncbi:tetratricopeptide repeat protein [Anaeromyxobacter oryzae]|uniref:tetratricopeptide repeat protein n=1 Tax=Anaeromyxobacter oryzae TaxID=2918170 RepID=UPI0020BDC7AB|nr:tetratricopeptide repeat protein [Anaeromyxobacter oryzae]
MNVAPRPSSPDPSVSPWPVRVLDALGARPRLAVALAAIVPFLGTLGDPPVLDDGWAALDNPLVHSLSNVGRIFRELYGYAGAASVRGPYRPLTTISYALDYAVHGRWTPGYHVVNVALHAAASLLVLALARRLARAAMPDRADRLALVAGLLFAVHPAHVEAVATIFGRTELLAACFAVGSLLLALRWREARWTLPAAVAVLVLGVLSKEFAVLTPVLFALCAVTAPAAAGLAARPGFRTEAGRRALRGTVLVAAALSLAVIPYFLGRRGVPLTVAPVARWFPEGTSAAHIALTMSRVMGEYLRILLFPSFLGGDFAYAARIGTLTEPNPGFWVATIAWVVALAGAVTLVVRRRAPLVALGLLWTFVALLPVMHFIPVGVLLAERLLYLPSVGFCIAAATLLARLGPGAVTAPVARRAPDPAGEDPMEAVRVRLPPVAAGLVLAIAALLATRTVVRALDWRSNLALWESELSKAPRDVVVNNNLAVEYTARRDYARAVERLKVALAVHPSYWRAYVNLGLAYQGLGARDQAQASYLTAMQLAPEPESTGPRYFLALLLRDEGRLDAALAVVRDARRLGPEEGRLARLEGDVLLRLGEAAGARAALERALALDPADGEARALLARTSRPAAAATP